MRILYCIPTLECGGAEKQLSYLAVELTRIGHEVHVAFSRDGVNLDRLKAGGVSTHHIGGSGNHDPKIFFRLLRLIWKLKPDIIQTSLTQMDILGGGSALLTCTRWILKESSSTFAYYPSDWKSKVRLVLARRADAIVSNSIGGDNYWRFEGTKRQRYVIPNGIPFDEIAEAKHDHAADLEAYSTEKIVLFAGRMDPGKNLENLIIALARIVDQVSFIGVLCGEGPLRPALEQLAGKLGISHRLMFPGYVSHLWALMKRADVFAFLSRFEGCPNVVLEAMACGCPLLVSDIPAHREILDDRSARFVSLDNTAEIAEAIKTILESGARIQARSAHRKAMEWTVEAMARRYERLYLNVIGRG